tara:strand:+ start:5028 stop:6464 length:1437 start_codon:yes stop_codon:yes gene_type:complete
MNNTLNIVWFRQDLRLEDNPALSKAAENNARILPIYILDNENAESWSMGEASRWWLHKSLESLNKSLDENLHFFIGKADEIIPDLIEKTKATGVYWNRCYEPWRINRDKKIKTALLNNNITVRSFNGSLLFEPPNIKKQDDTPYKVFTPFYKKGCLENGPLPRDLLVCPSKLIFEKNIESKKLSELKLLPPINWHHNIQNTWSPGEKGAQHRLNNFLKTGIKNYKIGRNRPDKEFISRLSPHLHFGELSPHQAWFSVKELRQSSETKDSIEHFLSELGWREFSNNLLYYWQNLPEINLQKKFDRFPWLDNPKSLECWQRGMTGYPIVDAGMRQLWKTGYMHNRVRMVTGSFLVKNLMLDWRHGERWFWDTLLDADLANNSASWQWIAGCGADAAPYFRIFNPIIQGEKFDPNGDYVREYIPELSTIPTKFIHKPWEAPEEILMVAGITLDKDYPLPIVDLKSSRDRALLAFKSLAEKD